MNVIRNYLYNVGYQLLALIVPLITAPYVSRVLTPKGVGYYSYTNSIIQYFALIASVGIGYYGNRQIAYYRDNKEKMSIEFWEILIVKLIFFLISFLLFIFFVRIYNKFSIYLWAQFIYVLADFKRTVIRNTLVKIISTILIFILVRTPNDLVIYILILSLSTLFADLTLWPPLKNIIIPVQLRSLNPWKHIIPTLILFIPQIATQLYVQLNKTMLGVMDSTNASGFYQYSDNLVRMVLAIVTSVGTVMLPHVANTFSKGDIDEVNNLLYKSFDFVSLLAFPLSFGIAGISIKLAPLFYGKGFAQVGEAMLIESSIIIWIAWSNTIGTQYLIPTNKVKDYTNAVSLGAITNIAINIPLIHVWGLYGAMFSTAISEMVVMLYEMIKIGKQIRYKRLLKNCFKYFVASLIMFALVFYLNITLKMSVLSIILEIFIGLIIYSFTIIFLKPSILSEIEVLKKLKF